MFYGSVLTHGHDSGFFLHCDLDSVLAVILVHVFYFFVLHNGTQVYYRFLFVGPVSRTCFMISNWVEDSWVEICVQVLSAVFSDVLRSISGVAVRDARLGLDIC